MIFILLDGNFSENILRENILHIKSNIFFLKMYKFSCINSFYFYKIETLDRTYLSKNF